MHWPGEKHKIVTLSLRLGQKISRAACPEKSRTLQLGHSPVSRIAKSTPESSGITTSDSTDLTLWMNFGVSSGSVYLPAIPVMWTISRLP